LLRSRVVTSREIALGWHSNPAVLLAPVAHDFTVNSARNTVMQLGIQFGKDVLGVNRRLGDIPDGGSFDDVTDNKLLDRFVLGDTSGAVGATDGLHVPASVLGTASVAPFASHFIHRSDSRRM
jgi:hypothetical protein